MARPSTAHLRRNELLPQLATTFADIGYRRATSAELASRCGVPENTLYRLFGDKKHMYLESIEFVLDRTLEVWGNRLDGTAGGKASAAEHLLRYEAEHYGEHGLYRIIFAGLSELDDPEVRGALRRMYRRFHAFIAEQITAHRKGRRGGSSPEQLAWSVMGMGTVAGIGRELGLITKRSQKDLFERVGTALLDS